MATLRTTDNNRGVVFSILSNNRDDYNNLSKIANTTIDNLIKQNERLLIFPKILGSFDDEINEQEIFNLNGDSSKLESVKLTTGNIMGFIGVGDTCLKISSRFSQNEENDFFMHYLLHKVFSLNIFDYQYYSGDNGELNLLLFTFPYLLKKALSQGIYKQYKTFERNDANIKGVISINRHLKKNIPFAGTIAYNSRERTFDNPITQLIRHTIEYIKTISYGKNILSCDLETKKCIEEIQEVTPSFNYREKEKIINLNLKPFNHPYFTEYKPLQKLCLAILRFKKIGYGNQNNKIYGVLFDGAWLWEEYLSTVLKQCNFVHPQNKIRKNGIHVYNGYKCYPDFYKGKQGRVSEENFILDAKYKRCSYQNLDLDETRSSIQREDLHQLITYMHILPASRGGLIYPFDKQTDKLFVPSDKERILFGQGGVIQTYGVPIPICKEYKDFSEKMKNIEKCIISTL